MRILWLQKWIILASVVVVAGVAGVYSRISVPVYESSTTVRLDTALTGQGSSGQPSVPTVPFETDVITDPDVLAEIAARTRLSRSAIVASLSANSATTGTVEVVAQASSPRQAQLIADAAGAALVNRVNAEFTSARQGLEVNLASIKTNIDTLQAQVNASIQNQLLSAQLALAVQSYQSTFSEIQATKAVANPASIVTAAYDGVLVSTSLKVVLIGAVLAGLLAGVGLALLRYWFDGRIVAPADVSAAVNNPVLSVIPRRRSRTDSEYLPGSSGETDGAASVEAIRALRTTTSRLLLWPDGRVVVVTGVGPKVGTTQIAGSLAASYALAGHSAIVASSDMRSRSSSEPLAPAREAFGEERSVTGRGSLHTNQLSTDDSRPVDDLVPAEPGTDSTRRVGLRRPRSTQRHDVPTTSTALSESLSREVVVRAAAELNGSTHPVTGVHPGNSADPVDLLAETAVPNLRRLPSLVPAGQGADALAGTQVQATIAYLREISEIVVLDAPPVLSVSDAVILGGYADAVIVVALSKKTRTRALKRAIRTLEDAKIRQIGVVINRGKRTSSS